MKIPIANPTFLPKEANLVKKIILSGWISQGKYNYIFEDKIKKFTKSNYALVVNNGTSAIHAILLALDIGPGDEVIIPSLTYISTINAVMYVGAKPILCDVDLNTYNVTPELIAKKITKKTKAFISVDLKGMPVDYDKLNSMAKKNKIFFISDSAESFAAKYKKKPVGSQCDFHTFSFFANKNITTGEGGAITVKSKSIYKKLKMIINQGQNKRYNHVLLGNNFRMTNIQAAIGCCQLERVKTIINEKNNCAKIYKKLLSKNIKITFQDIPDYVSQHSFYNFTINVPIKDKIKLRNYLTKNGIETRESFPPIHIQPYYKNLYSFKRNDYINSINAFDSFLDIPIWYGLSENKIKYIIKKINFFFNVR